MANNEATETGKFFGDVLVGTYVDQGIIACLRSLAMLCGGIWTQVSRLQRQVASLATATEYLFDENDVARKRPPESKS